MHSLLWPELPDLFTSNFGVAAQAAKRFLTKAIRHHGVPETITIDGSAANEAAIKSYNEAHGTAIAIRKIKYLNTIVEQDPPHSPYKTSKSLISEGLELGLDCLLSP